MYQTELIDDRGIGRGSSHRGVKALANKVGIDHRTFYKYINGEVNTISLDQADQYLCKTGRHLKDIYPWLYSHEQIEADVWATTHEVQYWAWRRQVRSEQNSANAKAHRARQAAS